MAANTGIKKWLWILLLAAIIYLGIKMAPTWIGYYVIDYDVKSKTKSSRFYSDKKIVESILKSADSWDVPLKKEDIVIKRGNSEIEVSLNYDVTISFFNRYEKKFHYSIRSVSPIKPK